MNVIAYDTETCLFRPACMAPDLVCITWQTPGQLAQIAHHTTAKPIIEGWLRSTAILVGHNVAYDMAVVCERFPDLRTLVFAAYAQNRVTDTMIRQQLLDIASGCFRGIVDAKGKLTSHKYTLEDLAKRFTNVVLFKDGWRLSYGEFLATPLADWPRRAREVQAAARPRLVEFDAKIAAATARKDKTAAKALTKERDGIFEMVNGDPDRASSYPLDDARATLAVYLSQEKHAAYLPDQFRQARAAWALHLESAWGLKTDEEGVARLRAVVEEEHEEVDHELRTIGLVKKDGVRDTKKAKKRMIEVCAAEGIPVVRTETHFKEKLTWADRQLQGEVENAALVAAGKKPKKIKPCCSDLEGKPLDDGHEDCAEHVCLDSDACERIAEYDDVLPRYSERTTLAKQLSNDIPALEKGVFYPVHTRYGLAATGRGTSAKPNIQNLSKREGFREGFVPRPGMLFAEADFPGLELYTWAQCCVSWFGFSKLADAINQGLDPHLILGAQILGISYEDAKANKTVVHVKKARQQAKPGNFGFAGGMGVPKFVATTRKQLGRKAFAELGLEEEIPGRPGKTKAHILREKWEAAWPESKPHFDRVRELTNNEEKRATVETLFTQRTRGRATYCATANNGFQALGADCAKEAAWRIALAQYVGVPSKHWAERHPGTLSPLYNCRAVAFIHDEFISEVPNDASAHDAAYEQADLMIEAANMYLPDVPIIREKMEPLLMRRWAKSAVSVFDANRRLVPWAPAA